MLGSSLHKDAQHTARLAKIYSGGCGIVDNTNEKPGVCGHTQSICKLPNSFESVSLETTLSLHCFHAHVQYTACWLLTNSVLVNF